MIGASFFGMLIRGALFRFIERQYVTRERFSNLQKTNYEEKPDPNSSPAANSNITSRAVAIITDASRARAVAHALPRFEVFHSAPGI
jgi:hypothetical protein